MEKGREREDAWKKVKGEERREVRREERKEEGKKIGNGEVGNKLGDA